LGPDCPAALQGPYDSTGFPVVASRTAWSLVTQATAPHAAQVNTIHPPLALHLVSPTTLTSRITAQTLTSTLTMSLPGLPSGLAPLPPSPTIPSPSAHKLVGVSF